jgi:hypothetical protein
MGVIYANFSLDPLIRASRMGSIWGTCRFLEKQTRRWEGKPILKMGEIRKKAGKVYHGLSPQ